MNTKLRKGMYGYIRSALLFYEKLVSNLKGMGFVVKPYAPFVTNRIVNRKQFTLL